MSPEPFGNAFLDRLDAEDQRALAPALQPVELERGRVLIEQDDLVEAAHFPVDAEFGNVVVLKDGAAVETSVVGREGVSGLAPFLARSACPWRVRVRRPGRAWAIPTEAILERAEKSYALRIALQRLTLFYQVQAVQAAACNAEHPVAQRLARWLLFASDLSPGLPLTYTQVELAELLGAQRTTILDAMSGLKEEAGLSYARGVIHIRDRSRLERRACECYRALRARGERLGILPLQTEIG
ncbi:Crp/Fnr family transcriptional regulator [Brevundimonas sp. 2R-24]|uniref:Crp/Fnr family transcriptional regulator n=1 Tax=Peiella sedimenti TaxID=3061083 RepID=A0ABT8SPG8_9CAUL|nr:Crp/Fnr family transcriptional regulator [Caulobacteraceae bacterium XZ-24]